MKYEITPLSENGVCKLTDDFVVFSAVVMYEAGKNERWLEFAKLLAHYCSSWVVTYSYKFPKGCEFDR